MVEAEVIQVAKINECKSFIVWILTLSRLHSRFCADCFAKPAPSRTFRESRGEGVYPE